MSEGGREEGREEKVELDQDPREALLKYAKV